MLNRLIIIDYFLIDRVHQPIVNQTTKRWGIGFISLAESCLTGAMLGWFSSVGINATQVKPTLASILFNVVIFTGGIIIGWVMYLSIQMVRETYRINALNPARWRLLTMRLGAVLFAPMWFIPNIGMFDNTFNFIRFFGGSLYAILNIAGYYFLSCQEGPPKKQKQRQAAPKLAIEQGAA